jgi:transcriptional regulator with XRE-family HTH domain
MSFSSNLRIIREGKNLSGEQLADLIGVPAQAVSSWEQDEGYPETEKVIQIAKKLGVSLDCLLLERPIGNETIEHCMKKQVAYSPNRRIAIQTYDGKIFTGNRFQIIKSNFPHKNGPTCHIAGSTGILYDVAHEISEVLTEFGLYEIIGWYATTEDAKKEIDGIMLAIQNGENSYQVKHYAEYEVAGLFRRKVLT